MLPNFKPLESQSSYCAPRVQNKSKKMLITHFIKKKKIPKKCCCNISEILLPKFFQQRDIYLNAYQAKIIEWKKQVNKKQGNSEAD